MRLAERLGVSLKTLLTDYSKKELDLWLVWVQHEPTEGERIELAVARMASLTHNLNTKKQDHSKPQDYMFQSKWEPKKPKKELHELTPEEEARMIDKAFGY